MTILEGIESIPQDIFYSCSALEKIFFPSTLKEIGIKELEGGDIAELMLLPKNIEIKVNDSVE